jgi:hypothetical protein
MAGSGSEVGRCGVYLPQWRRPSKAGFAGKGGISPRVHMGVFRRPPSGGSIHCRGRLVGAAPLKTGHQKAVLIHQNLVFDAGGGSINFWF